MMIDRDAIGAQIESMLLPSVILGSLSWWQVLIDDSLVIEIGEFVSYPNYTDREH